ncbi:MAG TPA: potassium uptake system protein [Elusimicrobia bacterium]|jgi:trk system potassium uptake protein TrkA|nr:potassium uptake system protein [Elusimicrobiota bacterium]
MAKLQFVIIGLGTFGMHLAKNLAGKGAQVLAIDEDEEKVHEVSTLVTQAVQADATNDKTLRELNISDADAAIVAIGESMEASILTTLLLKEIGVKKVIVKGISPLHGQVASKIGADKVVFPERDMAERLAESLVSPSILETVELSPEYNFAEVLAPARFVGKSLRQLDMRTHYHLNVIAIKRKIPELLDSGETEFKEEVIIAPEPNEEIAEGDIIVVLGKDKDIEKIKE